MKLQSVSDIINMDIDSVKQLQKKRFQNLKIFFSAFLAIFNF